LPATYGPPRPADQIAALLRRRGIDLDPERLDETAAAQRDRNKREFGEYRDGLGQLAAVVKRSRRQCEVEEYAYRSRPSSENLRRAKDAQLGRKRAEDDLLEACMQDRELYRALLRD
jgi:hypothetical protein